MKRPALAVLFLLALAAGPAAAETPPSVWQRARDPEAALAYDVHEQVQRRLAGLEDGDERFEDRDLRAVLPILQRAHAETSRSPVLRFDIAFVYFAQKDYRRAAEIYGAALKEFPDDPAAEEAWFRLAVACGHVGDNACELASYTRILQLETEELRRATPSLNLAETQMHLGNLRDAVEGYREVIRISGRYAGSSITSHTAPLAFWGLAIALDRSGDRVEAEKAARLAVDLGTKILHDDKVAFFEPAYELHWYDALGFVAQARAATTARAALVFWSMAEAAYGQYVKAAEPKNDRWLPIAKVRVAQVRAERQRAEKSAAREPVAAPSVDDADLHL